MGDGGGQTPVQKPTGPPLTVSGQELLQTEGEGYVQKQHSQL